MLSFSHINPCGMISNRQSHPPLPGCSSILTFQTSLLSRNGECYSWGGVTARDRNVFGARDMVRLGTVRCCYCTQRWGPVTCAAPSGSVTEDVVSKPRRLPRVVGMGSKLIACGSVVLEFEISNDDLAKIVETYDEWISIRTGIRKRRVLIGKELLKGLAVAAGKKTLAMAQVEPDEIDLVIMCTSTSNDLFSNGAQILSRHVDWTDRGTCILFGDGAGAVVVQATAAEDDGFLGFDIHSDGQGYRHINAKTRGGMEEVIADTNAPNFPPKKPAFSFIQMNGKEVFRFAVRRVPQSIVVTVFFYLLHLC